MKTRLFKVEHKSPENIQLKRYKSARAARVRNENKTIPQLENFAAIGYSRQQRSLFRRSIVNSRIFSLKEN